MKIGLNVTEAVTLKAADRQALFSKIKLLGVDMVRIELPWLEVKNGLGTVLAPAVADATSAGLEVLGMVAHNPAPRPSPAQFGADMATLAKSFPSIGYWEIWNEPNLELYWPGKNKPEEYTTYLIAAATALRSFSPAKIVFGGLAAAATHSGYAFGFKPPFVSAYTNISPTDFLARAIAAGALGHFSVLGVHPYTDDTGFRMQPFSANDPYVADLTPLANMLPGLPPNGPISIWATEFGFPLPTFTAATQQSNLAAQIPWLDSRVERGYVFAMRDNAGGDYGLLDAKNNERPAYGWLKNYLVPS